MGMVLAWYAYAHAHMHTLYRACCMTSSAKYKRYKGVCTVEPESWVKLLVRIRENIEVVYITIIFVRVLVGFVIAALSWLKLPGCSPGSGRFPFKRPTQLHGRLPGSGRLPGTLWWLQTFWENFIHTDLFLILQTPVSWWSIWICLYWHRTSV